MSKKAFKVLVSAYACEPDKGSEPGVGWNWSKQLSRFFEVWVITRSNNRKSIEKELSLHPNSHLHFCFVDLPSWLSFWKSGQKGIYPYYCLWQVLAFFAAHNLHNKHHFDVVQHVTFGTVWLPTFMQFLNIPFIWGPIGGAESVPLELRGHLKPKWRAYEEIRDLLIKWTYSLDPVSRSAMNKANLIIARTKITRDAFPPSIRKKTVLMIETGVTNDFIVSMQRFRQNDKKRHPVILTAGRLLHWKGFDLGIEAFSRIHKRFPLARLVIAGSGPEDAYLKSLALKLNVSKNIKFLGHLPREKILRIFSQSDIFLMPSMKEAGTWVLFEAMASGLPIVCLDYAGPAEIVDDSCAIAVRVGKRQTVVNQISSSLEKLLSSTATADIMGRAAVRRLENNFLWDRKGEQIKQLYHFTLTTYSRHAVL